MIITPHRANLAVACPFSLTLSQGENDPHSSNSTSRRSPRQALGVISHAVVLSAATAAVVGEELAVDWFELAWESEARPFQAMIADHRSLHLIRARTRRRAEQVYELGQDWNEVCVDDWLESPDGQWGGRPDLVVDRGRELYEYKTGDVLVDGRLRRDVERQVQLYAGLIADVYGSQVQRGVVLTIGGDVIEVDVSASAISQARSDVPALEDLHTPQPSEACSRCPYRSRCTGYLDTWTLGVGRRDGTLVGILGPGPGHVTIADRSTHYIEGLSSVIPDGRVYIDKLLPAGPARWKASEGTTCVPLST